MYICLTSTKRQQGSIVWVSLMYRWGKRSWQKAERTYLLHGHYDNSVTARSKEGDSCKCWRSASHPSLSFTEFGVSQKTFATHYDYHHYSLNNDSVGIVGWEMRLVITSSTDSVLEQHSNIVWNWQTVGDLFLINLTCWLCFLVCGDDFRAADRHADVHGRWLQGGAAGGEEEVLFPGRETLRLHLSDGRVSWQSKRIILYNARERDLYWLFVIFSNLWNITKCFWNKQFCSSSFVEWIYNSLIYAER